MTKPDLSSIIVTVRAADMAERELIAKRIARLLIVDVSHERIIVESLPWMPANSETGNPITPAVDAFAMKDAPTEPGFYWFKGGIPAKLSIIELEDREGKLYTPTGCIPVAERPAMAHACWGPKIEPPTA